MKFNSIIPLIILLALSSQLMAEKKPIMNNCIVPNISPKNGWYYSAIEGALHGDSAAEYKMGEYISENDKHNEDYLCWFKSSAIKNNKEAQFELAKYYEKIGQVKQAIFWYRKAANNGLENAQLKLAELHQNNDYISSQEAIYWLTVASKNNSSEANTMLIHHFLSKKSYKNAIKLLKIEYSKGDENAAELLGKIYFDGLGVKINYKKSINYYYFAALKGSANAQQQLSHMYHSGLGVKVDEDQALAWKVIYEQNGQ